MRPVRYTGVEMRASRETRRETYDLRVECRVDCREKTFAEADQKGQDGGGVVWVDWEG